MTKDIDEILQRFNKVKRLKENSFQCECPCHADKKASLSVSKKGDRILMHCHAGCDVRDILQKVGLSWSDLGAEKKESTWRAYIEKRYDNKIGAEYHYSDENGRYLYSKVRFINKDMIYGILDQNHEHMKIGKGDLDPVLYNLPALVKAVRDGFPVYVVEGEKDVETLRSLGLTATTSGSSSSWDKRFAKYFTGAKVIILPDHDEPGMEYKDKISRDLRHFAHYLKVVVTSEKEKGDVTDYIRDEKHSKDDLLELIDSTSGEYAPWIFLDERGGKITIKINEDKLAESILKTLDCIILKEQGTKGELVYVCENGVYTRRSRNDIKAIIRRYIPVGFGKDDMFNKVANLMMYSGVNVHRFEDINNDERYINVRNGLYDIHAKKLIAHSNSVLSTIQLNCSYPSEYKAPTRWVKYINELCTDEDGVVDEKLVDILQEWTGLILSNIKVYRFKKCMVLHSLLGNTGKSQYLSMLVNLVGIQNTINVSMSKMSSRWSMGDIYGKRLIAVGDQNAEDIDDSSVFKQLTGGDALYTEIKNEMGFNCIFNGGITINCNDLPVFKDDKGGHIFERLILVHCRKVIPEEKRDGMLLDKLLEERDQIFRWAMIGLHRLLDNGYKFTASDSSAALMKDYRSRIDTFYRFIEDNCEFTGARGDHIKKTLLEDEYLKYCQVNSLQALEKKNIKNRAEKLGITLGTIDGYPNYKGIAWKDFRLIYDPER
ncbi:MAG: phage/plasmid primase, P4 family [Eubacteriales bacterium]|nr:phage/plasmid primase, P4 family [Eubacteriales bacterium]MDD4475934.1 phage/plasmid primase, P4 family [Eubacteriales bacterium]